MLLAKLHRKLLRAVNLAPYTELNKAHFVYFRTVEHFDWIIKQLANSDSCDMKNCADPVGCYQSSASADYILLCW